MIAPAIPVRTRPVTMTAPVPVPVVDAVRGPPVMVRPAAVCPDVIWRAMNYTHTAIAKTNQYNQQRC